MSRYVTTGSLTATWLLALLAGVWLLAGTTSIAGWVAFALLGLMPPLTMMVLDQTPAKTAAQIIRDVEAGRSY